MESEVTEGVVCRSNITGWGRRRRRRVVIGGSVFGLALLATLLVTGAPWWARLAMFLPAATVAVTQLQLTRNTCIALAARGVEEGETQDTYKRVSDEEAAASRRVATTIYRDGVLAGVAVALLSAATALVA